jgi:hypothetical protein
MEEAMQEAVKTRKIQPDDIPRIMAIHEAIRKKRF